MCIVIVHKPNSKHTVALNTLFMFKSKKQQQRAQNTHTHLADQSVYWRIIGSIEARWFAVVRMVIQ